MVSIEAVQVFIQAIFLLSLGVLSFYLGVLLAKIYQAIKRYWK